MFNRPLPDYNRPPTPFEQLCERGRQVALQMQADPAYTGYDEPLLHEPSCLTCSDKGMVWVDVPVKHPMFGKILRCTNPHCRVANENIARRREKLLKNSRIPSHYADLRFSNWRTGWRGGLSKEERRDKMLAFYAAKAFAETGDHCVDMLSICQGLGLVWDGSDQPKNSLVFFGPVGSGKTALLACIGHSLFEQGIDVTWYRGSELIEQIRATYGSEPDLNTSAVMDLLKNPPVLVVDEMVMESRSGDSIDKMETIIDYRLNEGLPMIVTCNADPDGFEAVWGIRSMSRMKAMAHWIYVGGQQLRDTR